MTWNLASYKSRRRISLVSPATVKCSGEYEMEVGRWATCLR
jgi:hypothetical protein